MQSIWIAKAEAPVFSFILSHSLSLFTDSKGTGEIMTIEIQALKDDLLLSMLKLVYFLHCHSFLFPVFMPL